MHITHPATEDNVITAILQAELPMKRHDQKYAEALKGMPKRRLPEGFFTRPEYAGLRQYVLRAGRGWPDQQIFIDFPVCDWDFGVLEMSDLASLDYIFYDYWNELSGGTHKVVDGATAVAAGKIVYEQPNEAFWEIEHLTKEGKRFPPLVLLRNRPSGRYTIVEGHTRATGFALAGRVPSGQVIIIGTPRHETMWSKEEKQ